jgi:transcriptional regulator with XRE-family HTH domain
MMMTFADQVRRAIRDSGLNQNQVATATGLTRGALSRFMAGNRDMNLRTLDKIAPVIGVQPLIVKRPKRKPKGG